MTDRIDASVLGATGVVGQRFVRRLAAHPWFRLQHLAASERNQGKRYRDACTWRLGGEPFAGFGEQVLVAANPEEAGASVVFSALDSTAAREIEPRFAQAGSLVFSNASAFRMQDDVPLLAAEVNADHLELLAVQRERRGWSGGIVTNPNCSATILVVALAALERAFGIEAVLFATMQAVSGAGYPGVSSLDILANVVPFIPNEEEKSQREIKKMLGSLREGRIEPKAMAASAMCQRVAVIDGHCEAVSVRIQGDPEPAQVARALGAFRSQPQELGLPSAPERPIVVHEDPFRPQPRLDADSWGGMCVHVGRVRKCELLGVKFFLLGHNSERGAAGASVLNAELARAWGFLS